MSLCSNGGPELDYRSYLDSEISPNIHDPLRTMTILYHHRTRSEDAQGIHIHEMIKAFRELGHKVNVVALVNKSSVPRAKWQWRHWTSLTRRVPRWLYELMSLAYNVYGYWLLSRNIKAERPDLIYERYSLNTFCGVWASWRFGIPLVLEVNLPIYYEGSLFGKFAFPRLARCSERWICSHCTWTIVVTSAMKEYFVNEGVPAEKMIVIPNGVEARLFNPSISGKAVRQRFKLGTKIVVGFVGWFREWHGLEMLLEAVKELDLPRGTVKLLLVGDGPAYEKLYRYASDQGLLSTVVFTGPIARKEVPTFIAAMDIAVLPKTNEYGCPMKVIEYMAMGKCIVAPNLPVIRELLEDKVTAYLFTPDNREDFKRALLEAIASPAMRKLLGGRASDEVKRREFFWSSNATKVLELVFGKGLARRDYRAVDVGRA